MLVDEYHPGGPVRESFFGTGDLCDAVAIWETGAWVIANTDEPVPASKIGEIEATMDNDATNLANVLESLGIKPWTD